MQCQDRIPSNWGQLHDTVRLARDYRVKITAARDGRVYAAGPGQCLSPLQPPTLLEFAPIKSRLPNNFQDNWARDYNDPGRQLWGLFRPETAARNGPCPSAPSTFTKRECLESFRTVYVTRDLQLGTDELYLVLSVTTCIVGPASWRSTRTRTRRPPQDIAVLC